MWRVRNTLCRPRHSGLAFAPIVLALSLGLVACGQVPQSPPAAPVGQAADPGDPRVAYLTYALALRAGDVEAVRPFIPRATLANLKGLAPQDILTRLRVVEARNLAVVARAPAGDRVILTVRGEVPGVDPPSATGTITLLAEEGRWKVLDERWELGTPAGTPPARSAAIAPGTDVNAHDDAGRTPLYRAANAGDAARLDALIRAGADVNRRNGDGATPLQIAAVLGQVESVRLLIRAGAEVNATDRTGWTALVHAANLNPWFITTGQTSESAHVATVEALIAAGAWVEGSRERQGQLTWGATPLVSAAGLGHTGVVRVLIDAGADLNRAESGGRQADHWELGLKTALMLGAAGGHQGSVELLLKAGADVNARSPRIGNTALMYAAAWGRPAIVERLIRAGADVNARDGLGNTAMDFGEHYPAVVGLLRAAGAVEPSRGRRPRWTPPGPEEQRRARAELEANRLRFDEELFAQAAAQGDLRAVVLYLRAGMPPSTRALHSSLSSDRPDVALALIEAGAHPDALLGGITPLFSAAGVCQLTAVVRALIDAGANLNARPPSGATLLELTEAYNCPEQARLLREAGAR